MYWSQPQLSSLLFHCLPHPMSTLTLTGRVVCNQEFHTEFQWKELSPWKRGEVSHVSCTYHSGSGETNKKSKCVHQLLSWMTWKDLNFQHRNMVEVVNTHTCIRILYQWVLGIWVQLSHMINLLILGHNWYTVFNWFHDNRQPYLFRLK